MPDSLAHVVAAYVLLQVVAWRFSSYGKPIVVAGMVGALIPDVAKLHILLPAPVVETALGVPFAWRGLGGLWAVLLLSALGALTVARGQRSRVFGALVAGGLSHIVLDAFNRMPGTVDRSAALYPLHPVLEPLPGIYISGDYWPTLVILAVGVSVAVIDRRRS